MSESNETPQSPKAEPQPVAPSNNPDAFRRAENLLAAEDANKGDRSRQAFTAIEGQQTADRATDRTDASKARTERVTEDDGVATVADGEVSEALDEAALADGVAAAKDSTDVVWSMTPHNT